MPPSERAVVVVIIWYLDLQLPVLSVPIITKVVNSNPINSEVSSIQHYVIKFISDFGQVGGFLWIFRFPPPIKLTATINIVESGIKNHKLKPKPTPL